MSSSIFSMKNKKYSDDRESRDKVDNITKIEVTFLLFKWLV